MRVSIYSQYALVPAMVALDITCFHPIPHSPLSMTESHHRSQLLEACAWQWLCKCICKVVIHGVIKELEGHILDVHVDKMVMNVDVLSVCVKLIVQF